MFGPWRPDAEHGSDLCRRLAADHAVDGPAGEVEQASVLEVLYGEEEVKERGVVEAADEPGGRPSRDPRLAGRSSR
jgi:hypothetical protein